MVLASFLAIPEKNTLAWRSLPCAMSATLLSVHDDLVYHPRTPPILLASAWSLVLLRVTTGVLVFDFSTKIDGILDSKESHVEGFVCMNERRLKRGDDGVGPR